MGKTQNQAAKFAGDALLDRTHNKIALLLLIEQQGFLSYPDIGRIPSNRKAPQEEYEIMERRPQECPNACSYQIQED